MVSNLGCGADRAAIRPGASRTRDSDGWWYSCDRITIGFVQPLQELSCVGRETLDIAALSLGVERVECQRGLATA